MLRSQFGLMLVVAVLATMFDIGGKARMVLGDSRPPNESADVNNYFTASDLAKPSDNLIRVSLTGRLAANFHSSERDGRQVFSDEPAAAGGDIIYYKLQLTPIEESYSYIYSGPDSIVEPIFVDECGQNQTASIKGFATDLTASHPNYDNSGSISYRSVSTTGTVLYARMGRLRTQPYFYNIGHTYRVDAIADSTSGLITSRVYDVALGPQTFDTGLRTLKRGALLCPGMMAQHGPVSILDFAFGRPGKLPIKPNASRRAGDYMNYLGYNAEVRGSATSPAAVAFERYFPQLLIKHVRVPDVMAFLPAINAVKKYGIDVNVLTGNKTTLESLRKFIAELALPPDSLELWNEPNNPSMGSSYDPRYEVDLPPFAAQLAKAYPKANIWGPSFLPNRGAADAAKFSSSIGPYITAWNAHSYTLGAPENLGYGGFSAHACGVSQDEDCGYSGAVNFNDNHSAVINPVLPGVTTEGAGSYGTSSEICGHSVVSAATQQAYLERGMLYNFKLGHLRIYPYNFIDNGGCSFGTFGILSRVAEPNGRISISPKPAYVSLVYLDHILADYGMDARSFDARPISYSLYGAPPDVEELLLAESDGTYRLILWSDKALWNFNANGLGAAGSEEPLVAEPVSVRFMKPVIATVYQQKPTTGVWTANSRMRSSAIDVTINQYPLVITLANGNTAGRAVVMPQNVPTPGANQAPSQGD